jgi:hypothetical protein
MSGHAPQIAHRADEIGAFGRGLRVSPRALVIGGTGPTGPHVVAGLGDRVFEVTILHRGVHELPELADVEHLHADPHLAAPLLDAIGTRRFDVVVASTGESGRSPRSSPDGATSSSRSAASRSIAARWSRMRSARSAFRSTSPRTPRSRRRRAVHVPPVGGPGRRDARRRVEGRERADRARRSGARGADADALDPAARAAGQSKVRRELGLREVVTARTTGRLGADVLVFEKLRAQMVV